MVSSVIIGLTEDDEDVSCGTCDVDSLPEGIHTGWLAAIRAPCKTKSRERRAGLLQQSPCLSARWYAVWSWAAACLHQFLTWAHDWQHLVDNDGTLVCFLFARHAFVLGCMKLQVSDM